jgi:hypothetical protein
MNVSRIILIGGLLAVLGATSAGPAAANTLLSGYGGPGQGNQAILGSALVGKAKLPGRSRERGSGGGPGAASGASASASGSSAPAPTGSGSSKRSAPAGTPGANGAGAGSRRQSGRAQSGAANAAAPAAAAGARAHGPETVSGLYPASERLPAGQSSDALGVSGSELLYIVLAFAALAIAAVLTKGLARADSAGRRS